MLDGALITRQRIALGLTRHELARASGVSWQTLEMLERHGSVDGAVLLGTIRRVAYALGLKTSELLADDEPTAGAPPDATIVGTVLATHTRGLADDVIARALGWETERVRDAIATLTEQLQPVGQTLRRVDGRNQLAPTANQLDRHQAQELARRSHPLDPDHARVLLRVLRGSSRNRYWEQFASDERRHLMHLIAKGILQDDGGTVQPSAETQEALTLGRRRIDGDFARASRFRSNANSHTVADTEVARTR